MKQTVAEALAVCRAPELDAFAAGADHLSIPPLLAEILLESVDAAEFTEGRFDPFGSDGNPAVWRSLSVHPPKPGGGLTVSAPPGPRPDLTPVGLALAIDRSVAAVAAKSGQGVLLALGSSMAGAGACPQGGWRVDVLGRPMSLASRTALAVAVGDVCGCGWSTVVCAAPSCVLATVAGRAAVALGDEAPGWLSDRRLPSLLIDAEGRQLAVAGW